MSAVTDPISDLLTRIRNGIQAKMPVVDIPTSKMKEAIVKILLDESYIKDFRVVDTEGSPQGTLKVVLKYDREGKPAINGLKRISKPGLRKYADTRSMPRVLNNLGIAILSTSKGVISNKTARVDNAGGEVICHIW